MPRLNLGSGQWPITGYISVDISEACGPDIIADVAHLPIEDCTIDAIYASHILEHFSCDEPVLAEWHRVLIPGGEILIAVPDFLQQYELYRAGFTTLGYFNANFFGANTYGYPDEYAHQQVFTPSMLVERVREYFPDAGLIFHTELREVFPGETLVLGHKE
jgi:predicted SAM-dependent methyltransferase